MKKRFFFLKSLQRRFEGTSSVDIDVRPRVVKSEPNLC